MTKMFAEVFPPLDLEQGLLDLLGQVRVEKVTSNRAKNFIRIYLVSGKLIHKEQLFHLERVLKKQLFGRTEVELKFWSAMSFRASIRRKSFWSFIRTAFFMS